MSEPSAPLRVYITNCVCLNGGDAAIVEATMATLRERVPAAIEFTVLDNHHDVTARLYPEWNCEPWPSQVFGGRGRLGRLSRRIGQLRALAAAFMLGHGARSLARLTLRRHEWVFLSRYSRADLAISKGGTYLVEVYSLEPHIFDYRLCRLLGLPLVLGSQSLGPFRKRKNRRALRHTLEHSRVLLRDDRSLANLRAVAPHSDAHLVADAAFALADEAAVQRAQTRMLPREPRAAVSVRDWRHFSSDSQRGMARYGAAMQALVIHFVRRHAGVVTFLSTCQGVPEYWTDDSTVARSIVDGLPDDVAARVRVDAEWRSPSDLRAELRTFDLAVATRMHFAILALGVGVPVFPVAYEFKMLELATRLGLADWAQDIEKIDEVGVVEGFERFLEALPKIRTRLFSTVTRERELAFQATELVAEFLPLRATGR